MNNNTAVIPRTEHNCFMARRLGIYPFLRCQFCMRNLRNCFGFQYFLVALGIIILASLAFTVRDIPAVALQIITAIIFLTVILSLIVSRETNEIVIDNAAIKRMAEEKAALLMGDIIRSKEELEHANRAKTEFMRNVSHELRTPLASLIGYSRMLYDDATNLTPDQRAKVKGMERSGSNLLRSVNDLLSLSRIEAGKTELIAKKVALVPLVEEVLSVIQSLADQKEIALESRLGKLAGELRVDEEKLKHILLNLLDNAIKHTYSKGKIVLEVSEDNREFRFSVTDTGIGIRRADHDRIFEKFVKGDNAKHAAVGGVGLGLAIAKNFVEAHGGRIWVESEEGKGAKFIFTIPKRT